MMNLLGFNILGLDVPGVAATARLAFTALALLGAAILARDAGGRRSGRIVFCVGVEIGSQYFRGLILSSKDSARSSQNFNR